MSSVSFALRSATQLIRAVPSVDHIEFRELLDNDLMITLGEKRQRRIGFGSLAVLGLALTYMNHIGTGGVFNTSAMVLEALIGSNF